MAVEEVVVILEGRGGRRWLGFACELQRFIEAHQTPNDGGKRPPTLVECAMVVDKRSFAEVVSRQRLPEASFASQDGSMLKVHRANKWEVCGVVGGSARTCLATG